MALIDEIQPKNRDKHTEYYCQFIESVIKTTGEQSKLLQFGAYYMGIDTYNALIKTNMMSNIAALHAMSYGIYKQINREEQVEMFNIVWKKSAEYQLDNQPTNDDMPMEAGITDSESGIL